LFFAALDHVALPIAFKQRSNKQIALTITTDLVDSDRSDSPLGYRAWRKPMDPSCVRAGT
jgi:hypothetical protein